MNPQDTPAAPTQPAHAQPIDPVANALQGQDSRPDANRLQDVLPEINSLAQKVGGMKNLAEIAEALENSEE